MRVHFIESGWNEYLHWSRADLAGYRQLNELTEGVRQQLSAGLRTPASLKGDACTVAQAEVR